MFNDVNIDEKFSTLVNNSIDIFKCMEIAENLVKNKQQQFPNHYNILWNSFKILKPTHKMHQFRQELYEFHVNELLDRIINGEDTRFATKPEIVIAIFNLSLASPLKDGLVWIGIYAEFLNEICEYNCDEIDIYYENYKGQRNEFISEMRRKLKDESRKI